MPVVLELGKILGGFFAAIVACALGPAAGCNSRRKASRRLRSALAFDAADLMKIMPRRFKP